MKRSLAFPEITKFKEKFRDFIFIYFGKNGDAGLFEKFEALIFETELYFKVGEEGGWSGYYCAKTWNDEALENEADLQIFDLLFEIDNKNGADSSIIFEVVCHFGAFEAIKVRFIKIYSKFEAS